MPKEIGSLRDLTNQFYSGQGSIVPESQRAVLENRVLSDLMYGTPEERAAQTSYQAEVPTVGISETLSKLLNFPGVTNSTESMAKSFGIFSDIARKEGTKLITQELTKKIQELEKNGVNDQNLETYNKIWEEINDYSKKALDTQKEFEEIREAIGEEVNLLDILLPTSPSKYGKAAEMFPPGSLSDPEVYQKAKENLKDIKPEVEAVSTSIFRKLNEIKAPYLGQKFLQEHVGVDYGGEFTMKNYAARFNQMFNKDGSWKTNDPLYNAMKEFAYKNANPGDQIYMLQQSDVNNLLENKDLSESERVTAKLLEDITLNGLATTFMNEAKKAADAGDRESLDIYKTAINNINDRVVKSKKDYGIVDYNKFERSVSQFGLQFGRATRSLGDKVLGGLYDYEPDAAHLGNDIRFGPIPVDLNNDGKIDTDKYGNLIMSNQFTYTKKDGSLGTNFGAIPELSSAVIGQMAPILAIDFFTRGAGKALTRAGEAAGGAGLLGTLGTAAQTTGRFWEAANAWKGLRIADRATTFALVTGSVYDSMYADELRWTKDRDKASTRAWGRSMIEGLTEAIGAPEIGMFGIGRFPTSAKAGLMRMFSPAGSSVTGRLGTFLTEGAKVGVLAGKQTFTEALEEEMSLYGNYLYGKMIKASDKTYEKKDEFESEDIVQTFLDSFVGMAPYSLLGVGIQQAKARKSVGVEHQVLWDMANNPEYYKAQVKDLLDKKKFTPEQAARAVQTVTEARQVLDSIPNWENLKDLRTLLSDKDAQMQYFHEQLYRNKLVNINYDELTDEQKDALKNARLHTLISEKAKKELEELSKKETLTPDEETRKASLQGLNSLSALSTHQFTAKEKKKLIDLGVLKEEDLTNSKEDLLKELETVDKSILKKKEKIDQFLNMSEAEKENTINRLFDEQIDSIEKETDPEILNQTLAAAKSQLNFVETLPTKYAAEQTGRQRLIAAAEAKLGEQIAINPETGRNAFTDRLLEEDVTQDSFLTLQEKRTTLERNKKYVNEKDYNDLRDKYVELQNNKILTYNQLTPEQQDDFLVEFIKEATEKNLNLVFELDALKDTLSLKRPVLDAEGNIESFEAVFTPDITEETFNRVRERVFPEIAEEKKRAKEAELAAKEAAARGEDVITGEETFTQEEKDLIKRREQVDESGKSKTNTSAVVFDRLNRTKDGKFTLSAEAFANVLIGKTAKWLRDEGVQLQNWARVAAYLRNVITNPNYSRQRAITEGKEILKTMPEEIEQYMGSIFFNLAPYARNHYQKTTRRKKATPLTEEEEGLKPEGKTRTQPGEETGLEPEEADILKQANAESAAEERKLVERQNAVIQLQMPSSTYGFEVTRGNKLSNDPAIQRNADILRFLTTQDYGAFKVRITSRTNFLKQIAEAQGLDYQDFLDLLNRAHEEYNKVKGNQQKKAAAIQPLLTELNNFFGENFFEQTFDEAEGRGIPELIYMVEKNGANLSDPILTIVNSEQAVQFFNGYPFYTNIDSNPRILSKEDTEQLPYWENILGERVSELQQFKPVAEAVVSLAQKIKADPTFSQDFPISRVTQGTYIGETQKLVSLAESGLEVEEEDVKVLTAPKQTLGTEVIAGVPGQAFVVIENTPLVLFNDKLDESEAEALAMMVFDKTLREQFFPGDDAAQEAEALKKHIAKVINIFQKGGRKVAFAYDEKTQEMIPFIPGVSGKQLTQEELTNLFKKMFYNVDRNALDSSVPRFTVKEGEVVQTKKQSYLEFIKTTNKVYLAGNEPSVRRNQRIIFDMGISVQAPKAQPAKATVPTSPEKGLKPEPKKGKFSKEAVLGEEKEEKSEKGLKPEARKPTEAAKVETIPAATNLKETILKNAKKAKLVEETLEDGTVDSYYMINGVRYERVSTEIPFGGNKSSFGVQRSLKVGSAIDGVLRDVFAGKTPSRPTIISPDAFKKIVTTAKQIYEGLKGDYIFMTDQMTVWNEQAKIAGTIDMLLIDRATGQPLIVDFKTSAWIQQIANTIMGYNEATGSTDLPLLSNPIESYVTQQNSYGLMFLQQYGVMPELNIMYIQVSYADKSSENVTFAKILLEEGRPIVEIPVDQTKVIPSLLPTVKAKPVLKEAAVAAEATLQEEEIDTTQQVQTRLNEDLGVTSKIVIDTYLNGLHYTQTEDGKYYVIPDSNSPGYGDMSTKEVTKAQIIKPFRTEAEWKKAGIDVTAIEAPVSNIEAKKADIEKRRQEELYFKVRKPEYNNFTLEIVDAVDGSLISEHKSEKEAKKALEKEIAYNNKKKDEINAKYDAELAALGAKPQAETTRATIQMQPANIEKIKAGTKTTTTRSESQAQQINIPVGQSAIVNFGGQDFKVTNRGLLTIEEAGGKEAILKSEGVKSEEEFSYQQTKTWINGKGKLYVYDIAPLETKPEVKPEPKKKEQKEEDYNPLAAGLRVDQIKKGQDNKAECKVGIQKKKKEV
jgi:hypothetical protein